MKYVPISFKSDYSLMKSVLKIKDIIAFAKEAGSKYVGLLDDNLYSIMDFYDKCKSNKIKPIFGMVVKIGDNKIYLYIKDNSGYKNLISINGLASENKLTINDLIKYNAGLICVLPYENYTMYNRLKTAFEVYLGYKSEPELKHAYQISKKVLFINEVRCIKNADTSLLGVVYKIDGKVYEKGLDYVLDASEFDVETIERFQENLEFSFEEGRRYIPKFCRTEEESFKLLYNLSVKGLKRRLGGKVGENYAKRLKYELDVIKKMGFVDYFLIVYDYVKYAKKNDIYVGPGRGSAAGALVSYTLGITEIDPLKYDLLFERFLNPDRITMPDIDMDFEDIRRNDVINYVRSKYGERCVSLIVAYGTLKSRQAVRDVGKVFEIDQKVIDGLSKRIDSKKNLKDNLENAELVAYIKEHKLEKMYKISMRLEDLKKHTTIHAAGVVISSEPLTELVPTFKTSDGILAGFTMEYLEKLGLLKMDFLAIGNLTTIHRTVDLIKRKNPEFSLKDIRLDDAKTYELLKKADTDNVFQFETPGMKKFLRKLAPSNFDDLVAAIALFRPGPMQNIDEYIARRKGEKSISYLHPDLEPILKSTYGIIVYQEQIMHILSKMGGYTFAEADIVRRAMSKKKREVMESERDKFVSQSVARGYDRSVAEKVYALVVKFADYGFNKSHSVAYALVAYQMAYLKSNFTEQYHLNTLNMNMGSNAKTKDVIEDAKNRGLRIARPSINKSTLEYVIEGGILVLPLTAIKNVSSAQAKVIVDNKPYSDFFDFFKKVYNKNVNRALIEQLIKAGALEEFSKSKNTLLSNIDSAITYVELISSLDESLVMKPVIEESNKPDEEYSELDLFGFYVSGHPANAYANAKTVKIRDFKNRLNNKVEAVLLIDKIKVINTKKGEKMAFVDGNDDSGSIDCVIFPRNNAIIDKLVIGELYRFLATVTKKGEEIQLIIEGLLPLEVKK